MIVLIVIKNNGNDILMIVRVHSPGLEVALPVEDGSTFPRHLHQDPLGFRGLGLRVYRAERGIQSRNQGQGLLQGHAERQSTLHEPGGSVVL